MSVINILSPHVADMIAAGEVVERPASVVKELLENAVDAGAKNITVDIRGGGAVCVRVTDDGCGMAPDDAGNCFLRHATSKLRDERGLEAITTLGFRGEALAAISAVSRVTLTTRRACDEAGVCVEVAGGEILDVRDTGCPAGTDFTVRDLFYNTPARLKFMKSDRAEGAACVGAAFRTALGRPDVSVRCLRDGKEEFFTAGDGRVSSAVYALLGRDTAQSMLEAAGAGEGVTVRGYVSSPAAGRGNRALQFFFVNGRTFRSASVQAALEQAYKNTLLTGRYPACALYLTLSPGAVDVNVHPTKQEVKFSQESRVFDTVYHAVQNALENERGSARIVLSRGTEKLLAPQTPARAPAPEQTVLPLHSPAAVYAPAAPVRAPAKAVVPPERPRAAIPPVYAPPVRTAAPPVYAPPVKPAAPEKTAPRPEPLRVVGEILKTYIVAERGDEVLLIDKHAAHERVNFDRLKAGRGPVMSQSLLLPETWRPEAEARELLEKNRALLEELGFCAEPFGDEDYVLRGVPADMEPADGVPALEEICEKLKKGAPDLARDGVLQTIACKAAVKAGKSSEPGELLALAQKVASGEIKYCPHGRPVAVTLTKKELDKQFKRIV